MLAVQWDPAAESLESLFQTWWEWLSGGTLTDDKGSVGKGRLEAGQGVKSLLRGHPRLFVQAEVVIVYTFADIFSAYFSVHSVYIL